MAYEPGEERLRSVEASRERIDGVHRAVSSFLGGGWGSHRFNSHGYVSQTKAESKAFEDLESLQEQFVDFEFRVSESDNQLTIHYRTKGSKGWR